MNIGLGRPKFVLRKIVIGLDKPTSDALADLVLAVQAIGGQNETDAVRYSIRAMAKALQTSKAALQNTLQEPQQAEKVSH